MQCTLVTVSHPRHLAAEKDERATLCDGHESDRLYFSMALTDRLTEASLGRPRVPV
jgi:hypothetical protein